MLKAKGAIVNQPGSSLEAMYALSGWAVRSHVDGRLYTTAAENIQADFATIANEIIIAQSPMLLAMRGEGSVGHMVVLTGVTYDIDPVTGLFIPRSVILRDPWPGSPSRQEVGWVEFVSRVQSITRLKFYGSY